MASKIRVGRVSSRPLVAPAREDALVLNTATGVKRTTYGLIEDTAVAAAEIAAEAEARAVAEGAVPGLVQTAAAPILAETETARDQAQAAAASTADAVANAAVLAATLAALQSVIGTAAGQVAEVYADPAAPATANPDGSNRNARYRWDGAAWVYDGPTTRTLEAALALVAPFYAAANDDRAALSLVDTDGMEGLRVSRDFLSLIFGGGSLEGDGPGGATTVTTRDASGVMTLTAEGLALAGVLLSAFGGSLFAVGDEDGYQLLEVAPGSTALPGISATPLAARIAKLRIGVDEAGRGAIMDSAGVARLVPLAEGGVLVPGAAEIGYADIPGIAVVFADPEGFWYGHITDDGDFSGVVAPEPEPAAPDLDPLFGGDLYLLPDRPMPLYPQMLLAARADAAVARVSLSSDDFVTTGRDELLIDPARCGATGTLTVVRDGPATNARLKIPLAIHVATPASQTPRVLMIGDSITNRQQPTLVQARLAALGINPVWMGTVNTTDSLTSGGSGGPLAEARESRAYGDLVYSVLDGEAIPVAAGDEAAYLAMSKADKITRNPFLRLATEEDPPEIVRNGYVFDLRFYLDRFSFADPDILWVNLLENDCQETPTTVDAVVADAVAIVLAQARAAVPGMRIGFACSGQALGSLGEGRWTLKARAIRALISTVRAAEDPLATVVSAWAHQTPDDGWATASATTDPETGVIAGDVTDHIHPVEIARRQLAEATAAFIAASA
ncbi:MULTISPECIES: hypothetical protein [Roseomonadaceae]|uniref:SGNH/GDSL hydrolase family protein n=1 Tax=Falsiroseomonas oleicola TaxID=2801474 RepID=A0ABS6H5Q8_9PROT|nr:hypothetical protein [Roseomonas oleicola]MBU8544006.1 hypothetical protein [Roseomonas oleicola]